MNKKNIIIIAVSLAIILIGVAVAFAVHNGNDNIRDDEALKDNPYKESISSETDDAELKNTEHEEVEGEETSSETAQTEKETKPSDKEPAETKDPSKKPTETKPDETKPFESKPDETKPAESKPAESKPAESKPAETKPLESKPDETKPLESKPAETKPAETKPAESKPTTPERNEPVAADFTIYDGNGNKVHLSDFSGKPIILNFWASWCVPCKKEMPDFNEKYLEYGDEIQFLMIDFAKDDKIEVAKEYVSEMGFEFPVYFDTYGDAFLTYEVKAFPTTVFIDADGYVVDRYQGTISEETLQSGINKILK